MPLSPLELRNSIARREYHSINADASYNGGHLDLDYIHYLYLSKNLYGFSSPLSTGSGSDASAAKTIVWLWQGSSHPPLIIFTSNVIASSPEAFFLPHVRGLCPKAVLTCFHRNLNNIRHRQHSLRRARTVKYMLRHAVDREHRILDGGNTVWQDDGHDRLSIPGLTRHSFRNPIGSGQGRMIELMATVISDFLLSCHVSHQCEQ